MTASGGIASTQTTVKLTAACRRDPALEVQVRVNVDIIPQLCTIWVMGLEEFLASRLCVSLADAYWFLEGPRFLVTSLS